LTHLRQLAILAEADRKAGQAEEGLTLLAEALAVVRRSGVRLVYHGVRHRRLAGGQRRCLRNWHAIWAGT